MNIEFSAEVEAFRLEVRQFIGENLPADIRERVKRGEELDRDIHMRWQRILFDKGWTAPSWPTEYGGPGWSLAKQYVFHDELAANYAPRLPWYGWDMLGPLLIEYGTEWQKERFLPGMLSGEEWWCQGFSEPNAGSDLAALKCKAVLDGGQYTVNGSKIWTTDAHKADWMFALVRTDTTGRKQEGITLLFVDMRSEGLFVQPTLTFDGGREINQCFFDNVKVPTVNRIGEEGKGWGYAKYLLGVERLGTAEVARSWAMLRRLKDIAATQNANGHPLSDDSAFAQQLARLEIDLIVLEVTELRYLFQTEEGGELGAESSILKIRGTEIQQRIAELTLEALGYSALPETALSGRDDSDQAAVDPAARTYFNLRKLSIYGGSNEIQRNIVAKAVLGL